MPFSYLYPHELLDEKKDYYHFDQIDKIIPAHYNDRKKTEKLMGRSFIGKEVMTGKGKNKDRTLRMYWFFAPSRKIWAELNELYGIEGQGDDAEASFSGGLHIATRGMPTGITIDMPKSTGYRENIFILIEDDSLNFDLGRKSITVASSTQKMFREEATKKLSTMSNNWIQYLGADSDVSRPLYKPSRAQDFASFEQLSDLPTDIISYAKDPDKQEAAVVAIFHEWVGAGPLSCYHTLRTGYKQRYDAWVRYEVPEEIAERIQSGVADNIVLEFKYNAHDFLEDINAGTKTWADVDLLVCWDITPAEIKKFAVKVETIEPDEQRYVGATKRLVNPGSGMLGTTEEKHVLVLKEYIDHFRNDAMRSSGQSEVRLDG